MSTQAELLYSYQYENEGDHPVGQELPTEIVGAGEIETVSPQLDLSIIILTLYLGFFAWIGFRRGTLRELITLGTITLSWLILDRFGAIPVRLVNLGGKFWAFIRAGGLGENPDDAFGALGSTPPVIAADVQPGFLFIIWLLIILAVYMVTQTVVPQESKIGSAGVAALLGVANALVLVVLLLPKIVQIVIPGGVDYPIIQTDVNFVDRFFNGIEMVENGLLTLWTFLEPYSSIVLLGGLTLVLLLAGISLGKNGKDEDDE